MRAVIIWAQEDHINIRMSHSDSKAGYIRGIPEILFCRILAFMWLLGFQTEPSPKASGI